LQDSKTLYIAVPELVAVAETMQAVFAACLGTSRVGGEIFAS
jgi:hypothetical protein